MAGSVNKVFLIGNVGQDPDIRHTQAGDKIANLSLATSESWTDKQSGERRERTEWHRIVVFNEGIVGIIERYLRKGAKICVEGQLRTRKWTDQEGKDRFSTEVVLDRFRGELTMLSRAPGAEPQAPAEPRSREAASSGGGYLPASSPSDLDDDIPFVPSDL